LTFKYVYLACSHKRSPQSSDTLYFKHAPCIVHRRVLSNQIPLISFHWKTGTLWQSVVFSGYRRDVRLFSNLTRNHFARNGTSCTMFNWEKESAPVFVRIFMCHRAKWSLIQSILFLDVLCYSYFWFIGVTTTRFHSYWTNYSIKSRRFHHLWRIKCKMILLHYRNLLKWQLSQDLFHEKY